MVSKASFLFAIVLGMVIGTAGVLVYIQQQEIQQLRAADDSDLSGDGVGSSDSKTEVDYCSREELEELRREVHVLETGVVDAFNQSSQHAALMSTELNGLGDRISQLEDENTGLSQDVHSLENDVTDAFSRVTHALSESVAEFESRISAIESESKSIYLNEEVNTSLETVGSRLDAQIRRNQARSRRNQERIRQLEEQIEEIERTDGGEFHVEVPR